MHAWRVASCYTKYTPAYYSSISVVATKLHNILVRVNIICCLIWLIVGVQALHHTSLGVPIARHNISGVLKKKNNVSWKYFSVTEFQFSWGILAI